MVQLTIFTKLTPCTNKTLPQPRQLYRVDGIPASRIIHTTTLKLDLLGHKETLKLFLSNLGKYELILGRKWLRKHNPSINWAEVSINFCSIYRKDYCLPFGTHQVTVPGFKGHLDKPKSSINEAGRGRPRKVGAATFHTISEQKGTEIFSLSLYEVDSRLQ